MIPILLIKAIVYLVLLLTIVGLVYKFKAKVTGLFKKENYIIEAERNMSRYVSDGLTDSAQPLSDVENIASDHNRYLVLQKKANNKTISEREAAELDKIIGKESAGIMRFTPGAKEVDTITILEGDTSEHSRMPYSSTRKTVIPRYGKSDLTNLVETFDSTVRNNISLPRGSVFAGTNL